MSIDTARPRANQGYNFASHKQVSTYRQDDHILSRTAAAELWGPSWSNTTTTFRPVPVMDRDGRPSPYRLSSENDAFGDWLRSYLCFRGGSNGFTSFLVFDPSSGEEFDPRNSPPFVLYNSINAACNAGQGQAAWFPLLKGAQGKGASLTKPKMMLYMQGYLLEHKNKMFRVPKGITAGDRIVIFGVPYGAPNAAGNKLIAMLNQLNPQATNPHDSENAMLYGNPIAPETGRFFRFCEAGGQFADPSVAPQANDAIKGYDVRIEPNTYGFPAALNPEAAQSIIARTVQWDSVFSFPSEEEQALYLARVYPGDVIEYAFAQNPSWLTSEVLDITRARQSVQVPAGMPQQQQPQSNYGYQPQQYQQQYQPAQQAAQPQYAQPSTGYPQQGAGGFVQQTTTASPQQSPAGWGNVNFNTPVQQSTTPAPVNSQTPMQGAGPHQAPMFGAQGDPAVRPTLLSAPQMHQGITATPIQVAVPPFTPTNQAQGAPSPAVVAQLVNNPTAMAAMDFLKS